MTLSVQAAVAAVMAELPSIGKGDTSPEGYAYRGIERITQHAQPLFAKHGVVIAPSARITDVRPSPAMKDGWTDVFIEVDWTIKGPDGSEIAARTTGIGRDRSDKGANKAQTQAYKYLLLHLLCIADVKDDSDGQTYEHDRATATPPAQPWDPKVAADVADRWEHLPADNAQRLLHACEKRWGSPLESPVDLPGDWAPFVVAALEAEEAKADAS